MHRQAQPLTPERRVNTAIPKRTGGSERRIHRSRASGQMRGVINSQAWGKHEVWDRGSDEASYKSIYALPPPDVKVALLQIRE